MLHFGDIFDFPDFCVFQVSRFSCFQNSQFSPSGSSTASVVSGSWLLGEAGSSSGKFHHGIMMLMVRWSIIGHH